MIKGLTIKNSELKHKVNALCVLKFKGVSATEEAVLCFLVAVSINNSVALTIDISAQIKQDLGISASSLATCLFRLQEKDIIKKSGKVVTLNPIFNNINEMQKLLITFQPVGL